MSLADLNAQITASRERLAELYRQRKATKDANRWNKRPRNVEILRLWDDVGLDSVEIGRRMKLSDTLGPAIPALSRAHETRADGGPQPVGRHGGDDEMTEQEAKTKWCPFARSRTVRTGFFSSGCMWRNDDDKVLGSTRCIGSACMAWRWDDHLLPKPNSLSDGHCGLAGAVTP